MYTKFVKKKIESMQLRERINYGYKKVIILMIISGLLSIIAIGMLFASVVNYVGKINASDVAVKMCRVDINAAARNVREMALNDDASSYDGYEKTIAKLLDDVDSQLEIIKKILAIGPIALGVFGGIECMLWGSVLNSFVAYFLNSYYSADLINYPTVKQIKDILPTFCVSIAVAAAMWGLSFFRLSVYLLLPLQLLLGVSLAYLVYERTALPEYLELRQVTLSLLKRKSYT